MCFSISNGHKLSFKRLTKSFSYMQIITEKGKKGEMAKQMW